MTVDTTTKHWLTHIIARCPTVWSRHMSLFEGSGTEFIACTTVVVWQLVSTAKLFVAQRALAVFGLVSTTGLKLRDHVFNNVFEGARCNVVCQVEAIYIGLIL